jgi:cytochrome c biogenesis protein CcdA
VLYPRFDLPSAAGTGLLVLAAGAGFASFFSPCAFPLLVTLLARETGAPGRQKTATKRPLGRALAFATALSLGATLFLLLTGAGIAVGAAPFFESVTFTSTPGRILRTGIGLFLIGLGLVQLEFFSLPFGAVERGVRPVLQRQARLRREQPTLAFGIFGFIYLLAGFG